MLTCAKTQKGICAPPGPHPGARYPDSRRVTQNGSQYLNIQYNSQGIEGLRPCLPAESPNTRGGLLHPGASRGAARSQKGRCDLPINPRGELAHQQTRRNLIKVDTGISGSSGPYTSVVVRPSLSRTIK